MGDMIEFSSNGIDAQGYLAVPESGSGPGVIVVQEWWGLDSGIKEMADRLGAAGFVALAPDLYHGELAGHDEMDKAGQLMTDLPPERAAQDMSGAVDHLDGLDITTGDGIGVMGFCMGGMLTFILAANRPDKVKAAVPFYGFPQGDSQPDYSKIAAAIQGHMAEHDDFFPPECSHAPRSGVAGARQGCVDHGARGIRACVHGTAQRARHPGPGPVRQDLAAGDRVPPRAPGLTAAENTAG